MENLGKAQVLMQNYDAQLLKGPMPLDEVPKDKALVCVVNNGSFEAAGYIYDQTEYEAATVPSDPRSKVWLLVEKATAEIMAK